MAVVAVPCAEFASPNAVEATPMADVPEPNAVEEPPFAFVLSPIAIERKPTLSLSQFGPSTCPARNDAFSAYHIMRTPAPLTGGFAVKDNAVEAENKTELSCTWNIANGLLVFIPVFPFFKTVTALARALSAVPFPIIKTGSSGFHVVVETAVVSLNRPITNDA